MLSVLLLTTALAAAPEPGAKIANVTFKDTRFLNRSLDDFKDTKAYVLVFMDTGCPLVSRYLPTLKKMDAEYRERGVQMIGLFPGAGDSVVGLAAFRVQHDLIFPCVKDVNAVAAKAVGATRTPEAVVLDGQRVLRYRGRIDDQYKPAGTLPKPTQENLKLAIEAVLAGKMPEPATTDVDGCRISEPVETSTNKYNFAEHVAPIMTKHCVACHRPNTAAPFSLIEYSQVKDKAKAIAEAVRDGAMPPWYGAPQHTDFVNRRALSAEDKETVLTWLGSDMPAGPLDKAPKPPAPAADWRIGKPDLILSAVQHDVPESGDVPYKYAPLPYLFTHDTWIDAVEIKPDNPKVLHHCNMGFAKIGEKFSVQNFVTGAVPGGEAMTLPEGVAIRIPAGAILALQIHYVTTGQPEKCKISVGLRHARTEVAKRLRLSYVATSNYEIPPLAPAHRVASSRTLPCDAIGIGLFCHMHVRGRDMTFLAHKPDGTTENMLVIPNYNFDWQHAYRWEYGAKKLPKGTRLECVAHYDNSPFNPFNPDPKAKVRDGQQTHQEMLNGFVFYVDADENLGLKVDSKTGKAVTMEERNP